MSNTITITVDDDEDFRTFDDVPFVSTIGGHFKISRISSKDPEIPSKEKYWQYQLHLLHQKEFMASPKMY
jgi:hypothetical protein